MPGILHSGPAVTLTLAQRARLTHEASPRCTLIISSTVEYLIGPSVSEEPIQVSAMSNTTERNTCAGRFLREHLQIRSSWLHRTGPSTGHECSMHRALVVLGVVCTETLSTEVSKLSPLLLADAPGVSSGALIISPVEVFRMSKERTAICITPPSACLMISTTGRLYTTCSQR